MPGFGAISSAPIGALPDSGGAPPDPGSTVTSVTLSPSAATVSGFSTQHFTWTVSGTGSPSQAVTLTTTLGSISPAGDFSAPAATGSIQTATITATSVQDASKSGTATVTIPAAVAAAELIVTVATIMRASQTNLHGRMSAAAITLTARF